MARTNKVDASNSGEFKHGTTVGENGEILYDAPVVIRDKADMSNYGITHDDCKYLHLGRSQRILVYFYKTPNRAFAEYQWECLNNMHSSGYNSTRCIVPGTRKPFVKCPDTTYGRTPETKQAAFVSFDELVDSGWEPAPEETVERQVIAKREYEELRALMDAEDIRIAQALEAKVLFGYSVKRIAQDLGVSEPRVYQLIARAKAMGKEYRKANSNK